MATRWARFARGWVAAVFSTFVAALSHTLGGGAAPGALAVVLSLAFAGIICVGLCGRTLSRWRVGASVVVSQLLFHGLFSLGAPGGALTAPAGSALGAHEHAAIGILSMTGGADAVHGSTLQGAAHHDGAMWAAHGVAALLTIAALRYGEAAFWGLFATARLVIRALFAPVRLAIVPLIPRRAPSTAPLRVPRDLALVLSVMRHRGPPLVARVA
jgi:hypothetical protein